MLAMSKELSLHLRSSPFYLSSTSSSSNRGNPNRAPLSGVGRGSGTDSSKGEERFSDRFSAGPSRRLNVRWNLLPKELRSEDRKKTAAKRRGGGSGGGGKTFKPNLVRERRFCRFLVM